MCVWGGGGGMVGLGRVESNTGVEMRGKALITALMNRMVVLQGGCESGFCATGALSHPRERERVRTSHNSGEWSIPES